MDLRNDSILYINEGVRIVKHSIHGLILITKKETKPDSIQRALDVTQTKILCKNKNSNGDNYYSLEEVKSVKDKKGSSISL